MKWNYFDHKNSEKNMLFSVFFCAVLVLELSLVRGEYLEVLKSPCPDMFEYRSDSRGLYGFIQLRNRGGPISTLMLRANFTIGTRLPSSYVGRLELASGNLKTFNRGSKLQYRVDFPLPSPIPQLDSLEANGNVICYDQSDIPSPHRYISKITLMHSLFLDGQGSTLNQFDRPQVGHQPGKEPGFFGDLPPDAQIFMVSQDGNGIQLSPVPRPQLDQTQAQLTTQKPQQNYPEETTEPPTPPAATTTLTPTKPGSAYIIIIAGTPVPVRKPEIITSINTAVECGVVAGNELRPLIFNGNAYPRGDWPWVVAIYKRKDGSLSFICSGTLVSDRHVVSAAHCMRVKNSITSKKDIVVKVGVYNLEDWGDDITVTRKLASAKIHENYNSTSLKNDILVLTLERSVEFNTNIRPACLWSGNPDQSRIVGASGVVAGWGQSELGPEGQGEPRIVRIPVVSTAVCRASRPDFHKLTSELTLCAGDRTGVGPCLGDSGGGFLLLEQGRWQLRGVVSLSLRPDNGDNTCNLNEYIVFTDAAKYIDWIRNAIGR